jgi:photosystem II stability/assembly factor-like uncharacterized protein
MRPDNPTPVIRSGDADVRWRIGAPGVIERSTDGGATWATLRTGVAGEILAGAAPSASVCWLVGRAGMVLRTTDARTWQRMTAPTSEDLVAVEASDDRSATARSAGGAAYRTDNGGASWARVP